jgi:hypothetical protein
MAVAQIAASAGSLVWLSAALAVAIAVLCVETFLLIEVVRQQGRILLRLDALEDRSRARRMPGQRPRAGRGCRSGRLHRPSRFPVSMAKR